MFNYGFPYAFYGPFGPMPPGMNYFAPAPWQALPIPQTLNYAQGNAPLPILQALNYAQGNVMAPTPQALSPNPLPILQALNYDRGNTPAPIPQTLNYAQGNVTAPIPQTLSPNPLPLNNNGITRYPLMGIARAMPFRKTF